jgi:pimeloyl-ACP methyl ester carboxylesterase
LVPTLVVHGDEDPIIPLAGGRQVADAIPGAQWHIVRGMGHDLAPEFWDEVVAATATLMRSLSSGAPQGERPPGDSA